jgi:hypothetical protein
MLGFESGEQGGVFFFAFSGQHRELHARQAVAEVVQAGNGAAIFGLGTGGMLRVRLIRSDLGRSRHEVGLLKENAGRERRLVRRLNNFYNQYRMPFQAISGKLMILKVI